MTKKTKRQFIGLAKWIGVLAFVIGMAWLSDWNEYRSPWGAKLQAAKAEQLKATLCK